MFDEITVPIVIFVVCAIASISLIAYRQVRRRRSATTESGQTPTGTASG